MADIKELFNNNFIQYASYVIRDRAIPEIKDGLKPVQRRILHTLLEKDDGRFNKVAKICGDVMSYHPHGDSSIYTALVNLANKELFIEKQGNYGNLLTGDGPAAPRYIECRLKAVTKEILYNPKITNYVPSYDGRGKEPLYFRAKLPIVLLIGAEGIAVGMSTFILPHNTNEVIDALIACLNKKDFILYPDFLTGGIIDIKDYNDGNGRLTCRAKVEVIDDKRLAITALPYGSTTESLITSIEKQVKLGKIKLTSINDFTSDKVNIELKTARGVSAKEVIPALYAFTDCQKTLYCNLLVIKENMPVNMSVTQVIEYHAEELKKILAEELKVEQGELQDKLHLRTLERIFIEERIYKNIESMKTEESVYKAVKIGFIPFKKELLREVTTEDIEHLLKIPIRRISLYDINKNRKEVEEINKRLKEIKNLLANITGYATKYLEGIRGKIEPVLLKRKTAITNIANIDAKKVVVRNLSLRYDAKNGYLGTGVYSLNEVLKIGENDKVIYIRRSGIYTVTACPDKVFVGEGLWYCGLADKEKLEKVLFTILYKDNKTHSLYVKKCRIGGYIMNKDYFLVPEDCEVLHIDTRESFTFTVYYKSDKRVKITKESFNSKEYLEKGVKAQGVRVSVKECESVEVYK